MAPQTQFISPIVPAPSQGRNNMAAEAPTCWAPAAPMPAGPDEQLQSYRRSPPTSQRELRVSCAGEGQGFDLLGGAQYPVLNENPRPQTRIPWGTPNTMGQNYTTAWGETVVPEPPAAPQGGHGSGQQRDTLSPPQQPYGYAPHTTRNVEGPAGRVEQQPRYTLRRVISPGPQELAGNVPQQAPAGEAEVDGIRTEHPSRRCRVKPQLASPVITAPAWWPPVAANPVLSHKREKKTKAHPYRVAPCLAEEKSSSSEESEEEAPSRTGKGRPYVRKAAIKPSKFDGRSDINDYLLQFEILAEANGWDEVESGRQLAGCLSGEACEVLGSLGSERARDYVSLVTALVSRYSPQGREGKFSVELMNRTCKKGESVSEYGQSLRAPL